MDENGKTRYQTFRLPSLSQPSVYHEVIVLSSYYKQILQFTLPNIYNSYCRLWGNVHNTVHVQCIAGMQ